MRRIKCQAKQKNVRFVALVYQLMQKNVRIVQVIYNLMQKGMAKPHPFLFMRSSIQAHFYSLKIIFYKELRCEVVKELYIKL